MIRSIINPIALLFTLTTAFGVVIHDTQMDKAATVALTLPALTLILYAAVDAGVKSSDPHVHVERASAPGHINTLRAMTPRLQPREDDRRHIHTKKLLYSAGGDSVSLWPSV